MSTIGKNKFLLSLLFIPLILTIIWFRTGLILGGGDEALLFYDTQRAFELASSTWIGSGTGFAMLFWLSRSPFLLLVDFLNNVFLIPSFILQAFTFYSLMSVGTVSVYFLTQLFLPKQSLHKTTAFVAGLFYLLNPYSMSQIWGRGQYAQYFSFAIIPFLLLLFIYGLKKRNYLFAPIIALASLPFATAYGFFTVVVIQWFLFLLSIILLFFEQKKKKEFIRFSTILLVLTILCWSLVNAWWLLPLLTSGGAMLGNYLSSAEENIASLIGVSRNFTPFVLLRLLQETYFFAPSAFSPIYLSWYFQIFSIVPLIFVGVGAFYILKLKQIKQARFFLWIFLIGLFISLGANPPLGELFVWLFKNVPALQMFRNPYEKFGIVFMLGYPFLFSIGLVYTINHFIKRKIFTVTRGVAIGGSILLIINIFIWPMWTGKIVAFPDNKIGLPHPQYYQQFEAWLATQGTETTRILMTPIWTGDGAFYQWSDKRYQGVDPMPFFMSREIIGSTLPTPFFSDFIRTLRQNIYQEDLKGALALLRVKYLINRSDATLISPHEKEQILFLTEKRYPPQNIEQVSRVVCQNTVAEVKEGNSAWITCELSEAERNFTQIKYLHIVAKTDIPANLDVAIKDTKGNRPNWYGKVPGEYAVENSFKTIIIPIGVPTEINNATDLSNITTIDVRAHPFYRHNNSVKKIEIQGIWLDEGKEESSKTFTPITQFDKLSVFEISKTTVSPEIGVLTSIQTVNTLNELVKRANDSSQALDKKGFIVAFQNPDKNVTLLNKKSNLNVVDQQTISSTKYWLQTDGSNEGYLLLSKTFNPQWKVLTEVSKDEINGDIFNSIKLLRKSSLGENTHYVANGYANLWKINDTSKQFAVIFLPQLYTEIGAAISLWSLTIILVFFIIRFVKSKVYGKK